MGTEENTPPKGGALPEYSLIAIHATARRAENNSLEARDNTRRMLQQLDMAIRPVSRSPLERTSVIAAHFALVVIAFTLVGYAYAFAR